MLPVIHQATTPCCDEISQLPTEAPQPAAQQPPIEERNDKKLMNFTMMN